MNKKDDHLKHNLVEFIPAAVAVYDINTGEYVYVNRWVEKMLGYSAEDFLKGGIEFTFSIIHPDYHRYIIEENQKAIKEANKTGPKSSTNDPIVTVDYQVRRKNGKWLWVRTDGIIYDRTPDGKVKRVMNVTLDISRRKEAQAKLQKAAEDLRELNRAKDEFITIASHQLRTPATAIKQYLGLLLGGYSDALTEDQKNFIEKAYDSNQRQLSIVEDILRTAQLDADKLRLNFSENDIGGIVDEAVKTIAPQIQAKQQEIVWQRPKQPIVARVDRGQLLMVLENLIENASRYTHKNKRVIVKIRKSAKKVYISVVDEGVGIKKSDLDKLFQKFSRIPNSLSIEAGGSGLGLYWAERIVHMHNGRIKVHTKLHQGTEFTIVLPIN